jgi:hypothetical protein
MTINKELRNRISKLEKYAATYQIESFKDIILYESNGGNIRDALKKGIVSPAIKKMIENNQI